MASSESNIRLKLITWNLNRASISRFRGQLEALQNRTPDIIALQEVGVKASRRPREILREQGFEYTAHSHEFRPDDPGNSSGCAFASRWPFRVLPPENFEMPYKHQVLSAEFFTPFGRIEGHTVHVLPGSGYGETKVEMFEGIYDRLAVDDPPKYRFLCGDFNSPKDESDDGEVTVWGTSEEKIEAERSVIVDLAEYDLGDAYRKVNGYGDDAYSWVAQNGDNEFPRRFDLVFASQRLNASEATYLHDFDNLSDHTPLEVVFHPEGGLREGVEAVDRPSFTPGDTRTMEPSSTHNSASGLDFEKDVRMTAPEQNYRKGQFKSGWNKAVAGAEMDVEVLKNLTWQNLGWRLGMLFGDTSEELKEDLYEWCVNQQTE
jgi:exonuclease III